MPKRAARFVSAALVQLLASIPLATTSLGETLEDDQCLSGPKGETPANHHWYYRIDRASNRQCWYLRPETGNSSQPAAQNMFSTSSSVSPRPPRVKSSVAEARAEVRARGNQETSTVSPPLPAAPPYPPVLFSTGKPAPAIVASRWPDLATVVSAPSKAAASGPANRASAESSSPAQDAPTLAPLAAAASAIPGEPGTIRNLIAATVCVLGLAGITAVLRSRRNRARRLGRGDVRFAQGMISEMTDDTRIVLSPHSASASRGYRFARDKGERATRSARAGRSILRPFRRTA